MTPRKPLFARPTRASVVDLAFAASVLAVPLLAHGRLINGDGDLPRHLVVGRHILDEGPRFADPFSFSRAGEPFLAWEWLSQAVYAVVHAAGGLPAVTVLAGLLIATALALVVAYIRGGGGDPWLAFVTGAAAAVVSSAHWIARPHLFSFLGLAVLLHLLDARRRVLWLPLLFALWANLHPGFLYGLVVLAAWSAGGALEDLRADRAWRSVLRDRATPVLAATAATLLNPFGWGLHAHVFHLLDSDMAGAIAEFRPLVVTDIYGLGMLAVFGLIVVGLAARREWVGWPVLLVFGAGVVGALAARRNAPMFVFFALPVAARALVPVVRGLPDRVFGRMRAEFGRSDRPGFGFGVGAATLLAVVLTVDATADGIEILPTRFSPDVFPAAAVRHAREAGLEGRLLSEYHWGGYVLYSWPGQRVFVDSMSDFFGDALVREYLVLRNADDGWEEALRSRDFSLVLFPPDTPVVDALREEPDWRVAYEDDVSVLLARRGRLDTPARSGDR